MAKIASKGTLLKAEIASVFTTIAQVIDLNGPDAEVQTFPSNTLDQAGAGIGKEPTGFTDGGTISGNLFFDPTAATHQILTDDLTTPAKRNFKVVWSDGSSTEWPFSGITKRFTPSASLTDGLKAAFSVEVNGIVTYPT